MGQDVTEGDGEDNDSVYVLKVKIIGFAGGLNVGYEIKEESRMTPRFLSWGTGWGQFPFLC